MSAPTFSQINLVCRNVEASIVFYGKLGVDLPSDRVWRTPTGGHHASGISQGDGQEIHFDLDSEAFARHWNSAWSAQREIAGRVVIGFAVSTRAEVDDLYRAMTESGYRGLQEPYDALWGSRYAILADPDGNAVGLMSPVSPDKRSPAPDL